MQMTGFWSLFVIVLTVGSVVGCLWLLTIYSTGQVTEQADHVWDEDLREFNNPLPRWWLWLYWMSAIFLVIYLIIYPGMGTFKGTGSWTQVNQYEAEVATAEERYGNIYAAYADVPLEQLAEVPEAVNLGQNLFQNFCVTCHGSDGRGAKGFPNLTDESWLYGGSAATIEQSITNGRIGVMPALGAVLGDEGVEQVVGHVLTLSGGDAPAGVDVAAGQQKFMQFCSACHMPTGTGNPALGAPNLTAGRWVHGGTEADIRDVIMTGRVNQMPAQRDLLSPDRIRALVAYVLSLGS
jgi:cytochrome c oxidase cbb3-type subunit 3